MTTIAMPGIRPAPEANLNPRIATMLGLAGLVVTVICMSWLHIVASEQIDPMVATLSNYVYADGIGWMFGVGTVGIAAAGTCALASLAAAGVARRGARIGLWLTSIGSLLVALFPTDRGDPVSLSAQVHRYAAATVLIALPVAGFVISRAIGDRMPTYRKWLRCAIFTSAAVGALILGGYVGILPDLLQDHARGLIQRALLAVELVVLGLLLCLPGAARRDVSAGQRS